MHSWRVLLLPFLDHSDVYQKYSFNEPWDGPNNRKLSKEVGGLYRCPADSGESTNTSYVVVVGRGTVWPGEISTRSKDIRDGLDKTLLVVEIADSGINWMEPRDLSFEKMDFHVNGQPHNSISSQHRDLAFVLLANHWVKNLHPRRRRTLFELC